MLSRKIFEEGLVEIEVTFSNFEMTKKRADIWYKYSKYLTDNQWEEKIENCIRYCRKIPTLADILDLTGYYKKENDWSEIKIFKVDNYKWKPIPSKEKEHIHKVLNIPDRNKVMNEEDRDSIEEVRKRVDKDYIIEKEENCEN